MNRSAILPVLIVLCSLSCGKKEAEEEKAGAEDTIQTIEGNRAKADTAEVSAEKLAGFLPESFDGYTAEGKALLENKKDNEFSWSSVSRTYKKQDKTIRIILADYNRAYGLYAGAVAIISPDYSKDNPEEKSEVVLVRDKYKAWQSFQKKSGEASLLMGVADRFLIDIQGDEQGNTEDIRSLVDKINLEALSAY